MNPNIDLYALMARLMMVVSMFILMRTFSRWAYVYALLWWPSTFAHEASHFLLGVVFRAQPVGVSLWPRRIPGTNRYILGHVAFKNLNWWRKLPVATAPLLLMFPLGCWLIFDSLLASRPQWLNMLYCFGAMQCFMGCWPSTEDWAQARTTIYVLLGLILIAAIGYLMLYR